MDEKNKMVLVLIDPQNDFCNPKGSLFVRGADQDMKRLGQWIKKNPIDDIWVSLDTHSPNHIAHPTFWVDGSGNHPVPFTTITPEYVRTGQWTPRHQDLKTVEDYLGSLQATGQELIVWPEHCLQGSWGHGVEEELFGVLTDWQRSMGKTVVYLQKGENNTTEQYSAISAAVPNSDPRTRFNDPVRHYLMAKWEEIVFAGEALSHCVLATIKDVVLGEGHINPYPYPPKFTLLVDCCSVVNGDKTLILKELEELGVELVHTEIQ